ncbi:transposase insC for insertion element IS2D [Enterobacter kobei]|nr:transposase insC for insertion element IS2D [Enterobacter kobei]KDF74148.1 transposase insC for insertion element IS2D [Enterobacter kobei]
MRQSLIYGLEPWKASGCIRFAKSNRINFNQSSRYKEGSLTAVAAGEDVVPASELTAALQQVRELQRLLGKKTMEVEILKEAVEYGQSRKWIAHAPLLPKDGE